MLMFIRAVRAIVSKALDIFFVSMSMCYQSFKLVPTHVNMHNHCVTPKDPRSFVTGTDYVIATQLMELLE